MCTKDINLPPSLPQYRNHKVDLKAQQSCQQQPTKGILYILDKMIIDMIDAPDNIKIEFEIMNCFFGFFFACDGDNVCSVYFDI